MTVIKKSIKHDMVNSVLKDQFNQEVKDLKERISTQATTDADLKDNGLTNQLFDVLFVHQINPSINPHFNTSSTIEIEEIKMEYVAINEACNLNTRYPGELFKLRLHRITTNKSYIVSRFKHVPSIPRTPQMLLLQEEAADLFLKIRNTKSELLDVIYACRTVAKLQELTSVFDPFIPVFEPKDTALLPIASIASINKLKSPKNAAA